MVRKVRWSEWRINELARKASFRIQSDGIKAQNAINECLRIQKITFGHFAISNPKGEVFAQVYKLTAELYCVVTTGPGQRLEKLVEILWPIVWRACTRQCSGFVLDDKTWK